MSASEYETGQCREGLKLSFRKIVVMLFIGLKIQIETHFETKHKWLSNKTKGNLFVYVKIISSTVMIV